VTYLLRGALVEYGSDFLGPLPNVVVFQFNPESISRTIEVPKRPVGSLARESSQAGEAPIERFSIKADFDASDRLNFKVEPSMARVMGVGPQLVALEKMARPTSGSSGGLIGAAIDAIGDALGSALGSGDDTPSQPIPREKYPRILFIWGPIRVLPVIIESMVINEVQYDALLNPTQAEVTIGLAVSPPDRRSKDVVAIGAMKYTETVKEAQALVNLAAAAAAVAELIPF
jgi:hypothetical protein